MSNYILRNTRRICMMCTMKCFVQPGNLVQKTMNWVENKVIKPNGSYDPEYHLEEARGVFRQLTPWIKMVKDKQWGKICNANSSVKAFLVYLNWFPSNWVY
mmetsp:Transcript_1532/g.1972  ORF Transcript_1532/g.1972 Transcript_1532/m.1972 type:complete len:101 (+) Transcript_1532:2393-2695(+)